MADTKARKTPRERAETHTQTVLTALSNLGKIGDGLASRHIDAIEQQLNEALREAISSLRKPRGRFKLEDDPPAEPPSRFVGEPLKTSSNI